MSSIFRKDDKFYDKPNRNNFDLSFQNNFTLNAGQLVPVLCKEVLPGDSFQIDPTFGIRAMPLVWPIQTRMKAYLHFYYVRNRNLWKDWPDFIGGTKANLIPPYMYLTNDNRDMVETGKIGDYFGIPTVTYGSFGSNLLKELNPSYFNISTHEYIDDSFMVQSGIPSRGKSFESVVSKVSFNYQLNALKRVVRFANIPTHIDKSSPLSLYVFNTYALQGLDIDFDINIKGIDNYYKFTDFTLSASYNQLSDVELEGTTVKSLEISLPDDVSYLYIEYNIAPFETALGQTFTVGLASNVIAMLYSFSADASYGIENKDQQLADLPFISDENPNGMRISTMPFRALESVYNCIYRNAENNPLIGPDGQPEYNKWILNNEGGADTTHYKLHYRNWEDDFLTTALPTPQQGNAPLVGLTGTATINFASEDGSETVTATTDENGQITAINAGNSNLSDALSQMVDYGISINDFRNVNALQRWLENNIRRGFKYQDQIQTHYGVSVRYDELDMPEFIGGASQSFAVNQISQTVSSDTQVLGDYAGQASCVGGGNQITHYCDEHGYIIGVLCISPVPNYSQLLPKHFLKNDKFDYFFPEFGHIGMQPIPLKEITPLQTFRQQKADGSVNLEDTFGYQRAWYEYLASTDEVHGLFRNQLRNFVMNRTFDDTPELGPEFTTIDPNQLNDVFAVQDTSHKFLGQVYFDIKAKRPIPLYGIPKLE